MFRVGLIGLLVLIRDVYARVNILQSNTENGNKILRGPLAHRDL